MDQVTLSSAKLPPPFVHLDGIDNVRTIHKSSHVKIRPYIVFRGADPINITAMGKRQLIGHRITTITDMRLDRPHGLVLNIEGVKWVYVEREDDLPEEQTYAEIAERLRGFETVPLEAFIVAYAAILQQSGNVFSNFFKHLRDRPNQPVLVHCSAGKDRTGLAITLLLMLLGVPDEDIIKDYALSNVGLESALPRMIAEFEARNQAYIDHPKGLRIFLSALPETITAILRCVRDVFGGVENYFKEHMKLNSADLHKIRQNLLLPSSANSGNRDSHNDL
ncbi:hypothetical protein SERLA73DRAFT_186891 [Serpula lacrymans var. lacrymans S7.3]|uniref:Tyrosine specific protein phosphatases domain-containing protein n=2 Tax=Serpula lacrymans var. lacrymans TaxID=341189 RepID=F8Q824_SERL3|nr:uncharacterized protein SERLADRAFT_476164 [Serpula lacrymans var. lacrymans S7.9]EGN95712.1 hypothetical protein SERLA73DRAFT_186891 [Serpula lacrymans var. lacrymans S7.3]EGO21235.1 hypothetical protein SERLADRAFT_476164 [Serpula lacrymans var. lacrymans S7.9]